MEKSESKNDHPTNEHLSENKPRRLNSVIVRNMSDKATNLSQHPIPTKPHTNQHNKVFKDERLKYEPEKQNPSLEHNDGSMNWNWFKNLQNMRAEFAFKMMEAQKDQGLGPPHFQSGDYNPNTRFQNHRSKHFSNEFPLSETHLRHPQKQVNKTAHKSLYDLNDLAHHSETESANHVAPKPEQIYKCSSTITSNSAMKESEKFSACDEFSENQNPEASISSTQGKGKRGRPRKHAPKLPLPPLYVFIRNLLHNPAYNPSVVAWVDEAGGCFKVTNTSEFAKTWGRMKSNRSEEMNYEKMSRAMRYHYGCERQGRKGHLAMVKEKRLYYR